REETARGSLLPAECIYRARSAAAPAPRRNCRPVAAPDAQAGEALWPSVAGVLAGRARRLPRLCLAGKRERTRNLREALSGGRRPGVVVPRKRGDLGQWERESTSPADVEVRHGSGGACREWREPARP